MEIIATTKDGFLITAKQKEVEEVLRSVFGKVPKEIKIGQKIPAIDYAATITKLKTLPDNYRYQSLVEYAEDFHKYVKKLQELVENATEL